MKLNLPIAVKYCRITAAVALLALWLSFDFDVTLKYAGFAVCTLVAGLDGRSLLPWCKFCREPIRWIYAVHCVCLTLAYTVAVSYFLPSSEGGVDLTPAFVISAVVLAPIFEEILFRAAFIGNSQGIVRCIISSAIFGAFHGADFIQALLMGLVLSYFYISSGGIAVPIICHMANNLLAVVCRIADVRIPVAVVSVIVATVIYRRRNEEKIL